MKNLVGFLKRLFFSDTGSSKVRVEKTPQEQIADELNRPVNRGG